jgi:hypothetical protein
MGGREKKKNSSHVKFGCRNFAASSFSHWYFENPVIMLSYVKLSMTFFYQLVKTS